MIFSSDFAWEAQCLLLKGMWRKMVSEVRFGETFHKSVTLSLEQSPHKYLEMGMNVRVLIGKVTSVMVTVWWGHIGDEVPIP